MPFCAFIYCESYYIRYNVLINTKVYNIGLAMYFIAFISSYIQGNFLVKNLPGLDGTQPVWKDYISEDIKPLLYGLLYQQ